VVKKKSLLIVNKVGKKIFGPNLRATIDLEAKSSFTDSGLAQLVAQLYDLFSDHVDGVDESHKNGFLEVMGVLTTGHRLKFFYSCWANECVVKAYSGQSWRSINGGITYL
jgi:hypothetical protein